MNPEGTFSERHGFTPQEPEITIRHEAPSWLRSLTVELTYEAGLRASDVRESLCKHLLESPDPNNWSHGNVDSEIRGLLASAEWHQVYDFIEIVLREIQKRQRQGFFSADHITSEQFADKLNDAFRRRGVGWQMIGDRIEVRGEEVFEASMRSAAVAAEASGHEVVRRELHEARYDLSRRPSPDITGAIHHAMAALECTAREFIGDPNSTLGTLLGKNPDLFPRPLNQAVEKLWGFASERGRHLKEGHPPRYEDAELVVGVVGALATYLLKRGACALFDAQSLPSGIGREGVPGSEARVVSGRQGVSKGAAGTDGRGDGGTSRRQGAMGNGGSRGRVHRRDRDGTTRLERQRPCASIQGRCR